MLACTGPWSGQAGAGCRVSLSAGYTKRWITEGQAADQFVSGASRELGVLGGPGLRVDGGGFGCTGRADAAYLRA